MDKVKSIIVRPTSSYSQIPNELILDSRFNENKHTSLAFRLLCYVFSKPNNWQFYRKSVAKELGLTLPTLDRIIRAAKDLGWLEIESVEEDGRLYHVWYVTIPDPELATPLSEVDNTPLSESDNTSLSESDNTPLSQADKHNKTVLSKTVLSKTVSSNKAKTDKTVEDEDCERFVKLYNDNRGKLPEIRIMNEGRNKKIKSFIKAHGKDKAFDYLLYAVLEARENQFYQENRYNLDNLLAAGNLEKWAERYIEKKRIAKLDEEAPI